MSPQKGNKASSLREPQAPLQNGKVKSQPRSLFSSLRILFLLGPVVIAIGLFKNNIQLNVPRLWTTAGNFCQTKWDSLVDVLGEDNYTYWYWGILTVGAATFWLTGFIYMVLDLTLKPEALRKYKIQPGTNEPVDKIKFIKALAMILFNQLVVTTSYMRISFWVQERWFVFPPLRELPSLRVLLVEFVAFIIIIEFGFYYSHRLLHHRFFYRRFHKMHHEWTSPMAVIAIYCHPLEHVLSNLLPVFAGPLIMRSHVISAWLLTALVIVRTLNAHSGYHLPFYVPSQFHDFHHLKFTQCFGVLGFLDRFHNTDDLFRSSGTSKRHRMMFSWTPAREAYPLPSDVKEGSREK